MSSEQDAVGILLSFLQGEPATLAERRGGFFLPKQVQGSCPSGCLPLPPVGGLNVRRFFSFCCLRPLRFTDACLVRAPG